ncbi:MAG: hypothetical protein KGM24_07970 [Elusimicrobia bacterium]|nr:hypothetical protein [Elusimicrobiota bacterium]
MKRALPAAWLAAGALLLFWNLGRPALWQDEAETALRAESILETGLPRTTLDGVLVTTQDELAAHEGTRAGVWTWDTWLPASLAAASMALLGRTPLAARLPFALAGLLALGLSWRLFLAGENDAAPSARRIWAPEAGLALLALSPAFVLFCRQSRYYALLALGTPLVLLAWRRLLAGRRGGVLAVALSLQVLLHASFAFFATAGLALALDAALRGRECVGQRRFWQAAGLALALALPAILYFRVWSRPGNHLYGFRESLEFLKTFELWLAAFALPSALAAAADWRRWERVLLGFALLCGLVSEGTLSILCGVAVLGWILLSAARERPARGVMSLRRMSLLWIAAALGPLAFGAAEPYGRYLAGLLPVCAYLAARWVSAAGRGRARACAALTAAAVSCNLLFVLPLKAAQFLAAPRAPADSVSGMMRARLRALPPRSGLALLAGELWRGPRGYVEPVAAAMRAGGGKTFFADGDELSLMFATGLRPVYPDELAGASPDWLLPSPWLRLRPEALARLRALAASGRYEAAPLSAPRLLWQNNPDPLFHDFRPETGPRVLLRRR